MVTAVYPQSFPWVKLYRELKLPRTLQIADCRLQIAHCTLHTAHCTLHVAGEGLTTVDSFGGSTLSALRLSSASPFQPVLTQAQFL